MAWHAPNARQPRQTPLIMSSRKALGYELHACTIAPMTRPKNCSSTYSRVDAHSVSIPMLSRSRLQTADQDMNINYAATYFMHDSQRSDEARRVEDPENMIVDDLFTVH
eukprot:scaffold106990_cov47-Prasinocladus_malaysianus.AAC.1